MHLQICDHDFLNDVDEYTILSTLQRMPHEHDGELFTYIILSSGPNARTSEFYMQTSCSSSDPNLTDCECQLEYREGCENEHYEAYPRPSGTEAPKEVTGAFISYFREDDSWKTNFVWKKLFE